MKKEIQYHFTASVRKKKENACNTQCNIHTIHAIFLPILSAAFIFIYIYMHIYVYCLQHSYLYIYIYMHIYVYCLHSQKRVRLEEKPTLAIQEAGVSRHNGGQGRASLSPLIILHQSCPEVFRRVPKLVPHDSERRQLASRTAVRLIGDVFMVYK